jgi:hypothetical protein
MKRCPECNESFENKQNFCDIDGTQLVDEAAMLRATLQRAIIGLPDTQQSGRSASVVWITIPAGVLIGVVLSLLVYMVELAPWNTEPARQDKSSVASQLPAPARSSQVASTLTPPMTTAPSVDATEAQEGGQQTARPSSPSPSPSRASSPVETAARLLNNGPISTGGKQSGKQGPAIIRLKDGAAVEADAVWEDKQGVWYRRGGLVSFVDPNRVAAITEPAQPKPSPSDIVRP